MPGHRFLAIDLVHDVHEVAPLGQAPIHGEERGPRLRPLGVRLPAGELAVDLLVEGRNNAISVLQYHSERGFHVEGYNANRFRDRWGLIHARRLHPSLYDPRMMKPSRIGVDYLLPIFTGAIGHDDAEHMRQTLFDQGNLAQPYHSINTDVHKRIRYLAENPD